MMKKGTGCFFLLMACALEASAANHCVLPGISAGTHDGSDWANAMTALPGALIRGDTYYLGAGTYPGRTFSTAASGTQIITVKKATAGDHGATAGWSDAYGAAIVAFTGGLDFTSSYWLVDGQTGGGVVNRWGDGFGMTVTEKGDGTAVIRVSQNASNITIRHVDLHGKGSVSTAGGSASNDGVAIYGGSNVTISYFRMTGIGRCPFFISPVNALFEHGWVVSYFGSSAMHSEIASIWSFSGSVGDVTFRDNLFTDLQSTGGLMWDNSSNPSAHLTVEGNVFYKPPGATWEQANGVIGGWTGGGGEEFHNALVTNNTFINIDQQSLSTFPNIASGNAAYNNLFFNCDSPDFSKFAMHDDNLFITSGGTHGEANGTSASTSPFVSVSALDFRLTAATASGKSMSAPLDVDPLGVTRGADAIWDRGAFEFSGGKSVVLPPTRLRVVP